MRVRSERGRSKTNIERPQVILDLRGTCTRVNRGSGRNFDKACMTRGNYDPDSAGQSRASMRPIKHHAKVLYLPELRRF